MENSSLVLTKRMAQSIIQEGVIRDMELFNALTTELKQAVDDPEAKALLNRLNLIRLSGMTQKPAAPASAPAAQTPPPAVNQNMASPPVQPKINTPVQPPAPAPVAPKANTPIQSKVNTPPVPQKVNPPVQQKANPQFQQNNQAKNTPVQDKNNAAQNAIAAAPPKAAAPAQAKAETDEKATRPFPAWLWILPILLFLPGGIVAAIIARNKHKARSWELLLGGVLTTLLYGMLIYVFVIQQYTLG